MQSGDKTGKKVFVAVLIAVLMLLFCPDLYSSNIYPAVPLIVFSSMQGYDYNTSEIYLIKADGTGLTQLTSNTSNDWQPNISADGRRVVYSGNKDADFEIYSLDIAQGIETKITDNTNSDMTPEFSYDGQKIVFTSNRNGNNEIYMHDMETAAQTRLTNNTVSDTSPCFSPDGSRVAYISGGRLCVQELQGGRPAYMTATAPPYTDSDPCYSTDGMYIYFSCNRDGNSEIYRVNTENAALERLTFTDNSTQDYAPSCGSGGLMMFYSWGSDGNPKLKFLNPVTLETTVLDTGLDRNQFPSIQKPAPVLGGIIVTETPTYTNTATDTATNTPTDTATDTATNTPTDTATDTATNTPTDTATDTATNTPTDTATDTATNTPTDTATDTATNTPTDTATNTPTDTATDTATNTPTDTATDTATNTPTDTATDTATNTPTDTATNTPTDTATVVVLTPTATSTPRCIKDLTALKFRLAKMFGRIYLGACEAEGRIAVCDIFSRRVIMYDFDGREVCSFRYFGALKEYKGEFCGELKKIIALDTEYNKLTPEATKVYEFNSDTVYVYPNPCRVSAVIRFETDAMNDVNIRITDMNGRLAADVKLYAYQLTAGVNTYTWTLKNEAGWQCANGVYAARIDCGGKTVVKKIAVMK